MPKVFALVLAAGQGTRIGDAVPKQYLPLAGKPMMFHSIEALPWSRGVWAGRSPSSAIAAPLDRTRGSMCEKLARISHSPIVA